MCHNIRFHLGEYPHVSAKMCLGECADGSQIGRTYGLKSRDYSLIGEDLSKLPMWVEIGPHELQARNTAVFASAVLVQVTLGQVGLRCWEHVEA